MARWLSAIHHLHLLSQHTQTSETASGRCSGRLKSECSTEMIARPRFPVDRLCRLASYRTFVSTSWRRRSRDVMAKYRRPLPPALPAFETTSTVPAAASFQDVPPPDTRVESSRKAIPIPPMRPMVEAWEVQPPREEKDKEMIVLGIVIPPKPRPPKDDGKSTSFGVKSHQKLMDRVLHEQLRQLRIQPLRGRP